MLVDNIRQLCKENGLNFHTLEKQIGLGNGVIARWKEHAPSITSVKKVADYFNVTIDELLKNK